jgi:LytTr DNA-binding domain
MIRLAGNQMCVERRNFFADAARTPVDASQMGRQMRGMAKHIGVEIFLVLVIGLVLGLFGPFGTYAIPIASRIVSWMVFTLLGYAIFRPLIILGQWMSAALRVSQIIGVGLALAIAAVPMTAMMALLFSGFDPAKAMRLQNLGALYFQVWLIGFLINGLMTLLFRREAASPAEAVIPAQNASPAVVPSPLVPAFADRLPAGFGPILALNSEDHYVRTFGESRDVLVLLRLRDAIAELSGVDGMQVHRSWWVARAAVSSVRRDGRILALILTNGKEVPVAREKVSQLRQTGWLTR